MGLQKIVYSDGVSGNSVVYGNRALKGRKLPNCHGGNAGRGHQMNFAISCVLLNTLNVYRSNFNALFLEFRVS
jgi:hypothetical protein